MESRFESLWLNTSAQTNYPTLTGKQETEVVVVGGGIAGLMTAYLLSTKGKKVSVVEANRIATGTTAYTTAKITILHDAKYAFLVKNFGKEKAKLYADSNQWAIDTIEEMVLQEQIDCQFKRVSGYLYTNEADKKSEIQQEYEALKTLHVPVAYREQVAGLPFPVDYAIHVPDQAMFHPRQFLLNLAEIITAHGHQVYEHSRVTDVQEKDTCEVICDTGTITANQVVIATNYPIIDKDYLFARLNQWRSYAYAFQTADEISDDMFIGIGEHEITVRTHEESGKKWVIVGGEAHVSGEISETVERYRRLENIIRASFRVDTMDYSWSAQDSTSIDRVPLTGKMPNMKQVFLTTGYGEWGMTTSVMSAKLLTDLIVGSHNPWAELYDPLRLNLSASISGAFEMGKQAVKGYGSYLSHHDKEEAAQLKPGEGMVVDIDGEKTAVVRQTDGSLQTLSAVCTHMGCIVAWNTAERSWDCPCHGSRFTAEGKVIRGPAIKPLGKRD